MGAAGPTGAGDSPRKWKCSLLKTQQGPLPWQPCPGLPGGGAGVGGWGGVLGGLLAHTGNGALGMMPREPTSPSMRVDGPGPRGRGCVRTYCVVTLRAPGTAGQTCDPPGR